MQYMAFCSHNPYQNYQQLLFQADLIIVSKYQSIMCFVILINFTDSLQCVIAPNIPKIYLSFPIRQTYNEKDLINDKTFSLYIVLT